MAESRNRRISDPEFSAWDSFAYRLLRLMAHDQNRMTEAEISEAESVPRDTEVENKRIRNFINYIKPIIDFTGQKVLDIGCGDGSLCIEFAKQGARSVTGVDIDPHRIQAATRLAEAEGLSHVARFRCAEFVADNTDPEKYDLIISKAAFEHIPDPEGCLRKVKEMLTEGGYFATVFGPLWGSPYGAHMKNFTRCPWVHFLIPERVVLLVRQDMYRPDEVVSRYEDIKGHLNRITVAKFRRHIANSGLEQTVLKLNPAHSSGIFGILNYVINASPILHEPASMQLLAVLKK